MMEEKAVNPKDALSFIKSCVERRRILWTYHINMRMKGRFISRKMILDSIENYEIIESYPEDKYSPSYLVYTQYQGRDIHVLFAANAKKDAVTVVTAYQPDKQQWTENGKRRKRQ